MTGKSHVLRLRRSPGGGKRIPAVRPGGSGSVDVAERFEAPSHRRIEFHLTGIGSRASSEDPLEFPAQSRDRGGVGGIVEAVGPLLRIEREQEVLERVEDAKPDAGKIEVEAQRFGRRARGQGFDGDARLGRGRRQVERPSIDGSTPLMRPVNSTRSLYQR